MGYVSLQEGTFGKNNLDEECDERTCWLLNGSSHVT